MTTNTTSRHLGLFLRYCRRNGGRSMPSAGPGGGRDRGIFKKREFNPQLLFTRTSTIIKYV
eukprot:scaffold285332_cov47-Prasinocladus_malaysianus.AAC.1